MVIRTRKYALPKKLYVRLTYLGLLQRQLKWMLLAYLLVNTGTFLWFSWWWLIGSTILLFCYQLFWLIQFAGVTYLEQFKALFQRLSYEVDSRQLLIKLNTREAMPVPWSKIKRARMQANGFVFYLSIAQIIYLPFKIFQSKHEIKVLETLLRRKNYIN